MDSRLLLVVLLCLLCSNLASATYSCPSEDEVREAFYFGDYPVCNNIVASFGEYELLFDKNNNEVGLFEGNILQVNLTTGTTRSIPSTKLMRFCPGVSKKIPGFLYVEDRVFGFTVDREIVYPVVLKDAVSALSQVFCTIRIAGPASPIGPVLSDVQKYGFPLARFTRSIPGVKSHVYTANDFRGKVHQFVATHIPDEDHLVAYQMQPSSNGLPETIESVIYTRVNASAFSDF